jgi:uncharacterized membrane protein
MTGLWAILGDLHPILVHFPIALVLTAAAAEVLFVVRRRTEFGDAARFMVIAAACMAAPTALAGLAAASSESIALDLGGAFAIHRALGIVVPVVLLLAAAMAEGARRSGQIWELMLYRVLLAIAVLGVCIGGFYGGELAHGPNAIGF